MELLWLPLLGVVIVLWLWLKCLPTQSIRHGSINRRWWHNMAVRYDQYRYLYPPRPDEDHKIPPYTLDEKVGFWAQAKLNGTCNVMAIDPDRRIIAMSRHGADAPHRAWQPDANTAKAFFDLPPGWCVFVCELMHSKVPGIRNVNYINDLLVVGGEYLVGKPFAERYAMLQSLFPRRVAHISGMYDVIDRHTWLARCYPDNFEALFAKWTQLPECEGLVLKDPNAKLQYCLKERSNVGWLWKSRRGTKAYDH